MTYTKKMLKIILIARAILVLELFFALTVKRHEFIRKHYKQRVFDA